MYIILIKDNHRYRIYTNEIFTTEKETLDYVKRSKFKKDVKWKVEEFDTNILRVNIYNLDIVMMIWLITLTIHIYLYRKNFMIIIEHDKNFIRCVNVSHLLIQYFWVHHKINIWLP